ncbi:MAG: DUF378 domain-containing protein [candidate division Zixibacteria bacterium]|nr:DUF378 domain-containing protein [candidate division Zixibacteria bacterium]
MKTLDVITFILMVIGGLNWGLVGMFSFDLVAAIFGTLSLASRIVYLIVAVCTLYHLIWWRGICRRWTGKPA